MVMSRGYSILRLLAICSGLHVIARQKCPVSSKAEMSGFHATVSSSSFSFGATFSFC